MSDKLKNVYEAALSLDERERAELASLLLGTLDDDGEVVDQAEIDAAWVVEIRRRVANLDESQLISSDEVNRIIKARKMP